MNRNTDDDKSKGRDICVRTRTFALRIINLYQSVEHGAVGRVLGNQMLRSGTSIGANVEEAQAGQSRADFISKMNIALKEARETRYWLLLLNDAHITQTDTTQSMLDELNQIMKILFTIIQNTKSNR